MDNPDTWRWIWLTAAVLLGIGEIATGGLFLLPFAIGAAGALILALTGFGVAVQMVVFLVLSVAAFASFRPIARRLDAQGVTEGIGARRLVGQLGVVTEPINLEGTGEVRIERELWRASSEDGSVIEAGGQVRVVEMRGTRVVVSAVDPTAGGVTEIGD